MKAIILAAGRGTRISKYIQEKPKCTVDIGGMSLIENTVNQLKDYGINDIAVVVGYKCEVIEKILNNKGIKFYYNPFYDVTNSIASLWFAREFVCSDDVLFLNGDVFFEDRILQQVIEERLSPVFFSDETRKENGDYKFFYENEKLIKYGKELSGKDVTGEYIGIARVNKEDLHILLDRLEMLISSQKHSLWWEDVIYSLSKEIDVYVKDVKKQFWAEVDYIDDYQRIIDYKFMVSTDQQNNEFKIKALFKNSVEIQ